MLNLTLRNIPTELHARLKESAERNRRSLNSEILARLESDFSAPVVEREERVLALRSLVAGLPRVDHTNVTRYKRKGRA